jgi:uncharacterized membrane protein
MIEESPEPRRLDVGPGVRASAWILASMVLASAVAGWLLPAGAAVAVHWGLDGRPDRFLPKAQALLAMPIAAALTAAILAGVPFLEPRRANLARSAKFYLRAWIGSLLLTAVAHGALVAAALGAALDVTRVVAVATAAFVAALGDSLAKSRSNFMAGIRTPWTLSSDLAWEMAHRWTGRLLVATGVSAAAASLAGAPAAGIAVVVAGTFVSLTAGAGISYVYWRRDAERR